MSEYIYKCSFFNNKHSKMSHTDMYYKNAEHTHWVFNHQRDYARVELIRVDITSVEYESAVNNSNLQIMKQKEILEKCFFDK